MFRWAWWGLVRSRRPPTEHPKWPLSTKVNTIVGSPVSHINYTRNPFSRLPSLRFVAGRHQSRSEIGRRAAHRVVERSTTKEIIESVARIKIDRFEGGGRGWGRRLHGTHRAHRFRRDHLRSIANDGHYRQRGKHNIHTGHSIECIAWQLLDQFCHRCDP